jgi:hypothetical protein
MHGARNHLSQLGASPWQREDEVASVRSRTAGVMMTLMRNGRDRRSENPLRATRGKNACFCLGPISGSHQGQQPNGCTQRPRERDYWPFAVLRDSGANTFRTSDWHSPAVQRCPLLRRLVGVKRKCCERHQFDAHDPQATSVKLKFRGAAVLCYPLSEAQEALDSGTTRVHHAMHHRLNP